MPQAREIWEEPLTTNRRFVDRHFRRRFRPGEGVRDLLRFPAPLRPAPGAVQDQVARPDFPHRLPGGPGHKRRIPPAGLAKELLTFALRSLREKGVFTFLMPFAIPFYTRLGWGVCGQHRIYRLAPGAGIPGERAPGSPGKPGRAERESPSNQLLPGRRTHRTRLFWTGSTGTGVLTWTVGCCGGKRTGKACFLTTSSMAVKYGSLRKPVPGQRLTPSFIPVQREPPAGTGVPDAGGRPPAVAAFGGKKQQTAGLERTGCGHALSFTGTGGETGFPGADHRSPAPPWSSTITPRQARRAPGACGWKIPPSSREQRGFPSYPGKRRENASHPRPRGCRSTCTIGDPVCLLSGTNGPEEAIKNAF